MFRTLVFTFVYFSLSKVLFKNSWSALRCSQPPGEYETANWSALADILSSAKQASNKITSKKRKANGNQRAEIRGVCRKESRSTGTQPVFADG